MRFIEDVGVSDRNDFDGGKGEKAPDGGTEKIGEVVAGGPEERAKNQGPSRERVGVAYGELFEPNQKVSEKCEVGEDAGEAEVHVRLGDGGKSHAAIIFVGPGIDHSGDPVIRRKVVFARRGGGFPTEREIGNDSLHANPIGFAPTKIAGTDEVDGFEKRANAHAHFGGAIQDVEVFEGKLREALVERRFTTGAKYG